MGCVFYAVTFLFVCFRTQAGEQQRNAMANALNYKTENRNNTERKTTRKIMESTNTSSWSEGRVISTNIV